jgi:DNA-binding beta-propeller fold protein YncE
MLTRYVRDRVYNYEYCIGRNAQAGAGFSQPMDFAVGDGGALYVVNKANEFNPGHGLTKCTLGSEFLWEDRGLGFAGGDSPWPASVALDSEEKVYVSDDHTCRITVYDKDGNRLGAWGTKGSGPGQLNGPSGLGFDNEDNLYIVDALNSRVQVFTKDGKFLHKWGSHGAGEGQFHMPWGIGIDKGGAVYVADWKNDRVQKFTSRGKYLATFGACGTGEGELQRPSSVAVDDGGDVYVVDWGNNRLNIYDADAEFLTSFVGDADKLPKWGQDSVDANPDYQKARRRVDLSPEYLFRRPVAVKVDGDGHIIVLETNSGRIQVYVKEKAFVDAPANL